jgi:plastocyanin
MRRTISMLALAAALLTACGGTESDAGANCDSTVTAEDDVFQPSCAKVDSGQEVTVTNTGDALHSFTVDELGLHRDLAAGETISVTIEADPGEYPFHCHYHPGMDGTLTVT